MEPADLRRALELREAVRSLLLANNGVEPDPTALQTLERLADEGRLTVRFDGDSAAFVSAATGASGALASLVGIVATSMMEGTWPRMKACRRDVCHWAFYDRSRNRSSTWCHMSVCGNRAKTRAYRERQRSA